MKVEATLERDCPAGSPARIRCVISNRIEHSIAWQDRVSAFREVDRPALQLDREIGVEQRSGHHLLPVKAAAIMRRRKQLGAGETWSRVMMSAVRGVRARIGRSGSQIAPKQGRIAKCR